MALLEAEIAHLRAQLRAGDEEKDVQVGDSGRLMSLAFGVHALALLDLLVSRGLNLTSCMQLINLRRRVLVLGVQLNKAVTGQMLACWLPISSLRVVNSSCSTIFP